LQVQIIIQILPTTPPLTHPMTPVCIFRVHLHLRASCKPVMCLFTVLITVLIDGRRVPIGRPRGRVRPHP
jgi:hypothetical protein